MIYKYSFNSTSTLKSNMRNINYIYNCILNSFKSTNSYFDELDLDIDYIDENFCNDFEDIAYNITEKAIQNNEITLDMQQPLFNVLMTIYARNGIPELFEKGLFVIIYDSLSGGLSIDSAFIETADLYTYTICFNVYIDQILKKYM